MSPLAEKRYREVLRYILALEEAEDTANALVELLSYVLPYDGAVYIRLERSGLLKDVRAASYDSTIKEALSQNSLVLKDPLFDFGNRASGMTMRDTRIVDLSHPDTPDDKAYHVSLSELGFAEYMSLCISEIGDGIRLYRKQESPRFTKEDIQIGNLVADALRRAMPRYREYEARHTEYLLGSMMPNLLPFGILLFDNEFHLLHYNTLALNRISQVTGEKSFREMMEVFTEIVKERTAAMYARYDLQEHSLIGDGKFILEILPKEEMDDNGILRSYLTVMLYSSEWFHDYLTDSMESILQRFGLTEREQEIADLIIRGMGNKDIAAKTFISTNTVKEHIKNIYLKMDVNSRGEMIAKVFTGQEESAEE